MSLASSLRCAKVGCNGKLDVEGETVQLGHRVARVHCKKCGLIMEVMEWTKSGAR